MDELFPAEEVKLDSPRLRWMAKHGVITWYDNGQRDGHEVCPAQWFAGFQKWWPGKNGIEFFALETADHGDSRIGEGEDEEGAIAHLLTSWDGHGIDKKLWHA